MVVEQLKSLRHCNCQVGALTWGDVGHDGLFDFSMQITTIIDWIRKRQRNLDVVFIAKKGECKLDSTLVWNLECALSTVIFV